MSHCAALGDQRHALSVLLSQADVTPSSGYWCEQCVRQLRGSLIYAEPRDGADACVLAEGTSSMEQTLRKRHACQIHNGLCRPTTSRQPRSTCLEALPQVQLDRTTTCCYAEEAFLVSLPMAYQGGQSTGKPAACEPLWSKEA
jgi:hypothetical protein